MQTCGHGHVVGGRTGRRDFMVAAGSLVLSGSAASAQEGTLAEHEEEKVSANEDLMREHGILQRCLLIYEEGLRRLRVTEDLPPDALHDTARLVRAFIEDYHERLEEQYLFPRFRERNQLVELVDVLEGQHQAGRNVTDVVLRHTQASIPKEGDARNELVSALQSFIRMYRPHEAREDTVLFPAFKEVVSQNEYDSLGEDFETKEHELFGDDGFQGVVAHVKSLEERLGIFDLGQFTPRPDDVA